MLARYLSRMLGARESQIANEPEILDKFIGKFCARFLSNDDVILHSWDDEMGLA